jgi:hypothetical protein
LSTVPSGAGLSGEFVLPSRSGGGRCRLEEDLIKRGYAFKQHLKLADCKRLGCKKCLKCLSISNDVGSDGAKSLSGRNYATRYSTTAANIA